MEPSITIPPEIIKEGFVPYIQEDNVYNYYEPGHKAKADGLSTKEWDERIARSHKQFIPGSWKTQCVEVTKWDSPTEIEKLTIGRFFLAHCNPSYSLWCVLEICNELDRVFCGATAKDLQKVQQWPVSMTPFVYLMSPAVEKKWRQSMRTLRKAIREDSFSFEVLIDRLHAITAGVKELEKALELLDRNFATNLPENPYVDWIKEKVHQAAAMRFSMVIELTKFDNNKSIVEPISEISSEAAQTTTQDDAGPTDFGGVIGSRDFAYESGGNTVQTVERSTLALAMLIQILLTEGFRKIIKRPSLATTGALLEHGMPANQRHMHVARGCSPKSLPE
ncbi:MAG: hypothetical protein M1834_002602 [Cirrosporium novae-zelandiae]|nr:MAG: hypothetical protein M1834_002602 [Cirrosporium novae-zelandiae]